MSRVDPPYDLLLAIGLRLKAFTLGRIERLTYIIAVPGYVRRNFKKEQRVDKRLSRSVSSKKSLTACPPWYACASHGHRKSYPKHLNNR